jgi:hypothetical protein
MSNYKTHAMTEFKAAGWLDENGEFKDEMQKDICNHVLKLLEVFDNEGHSGSTATYSVDLFSKLALFKPIGQLTGEDWEWGKINDEESGGVDTWQNKRCSAVFKQSDRFGGQPYYLDAIVFWDWYTDPETGEKSKLYYTNKDSMQPIEFPYTPHTEYQYKESDVQ